MNYKIFGSRTGLRVSELVLGTGNFGNAWGFGSTKEEARLIFDGYLNAGGNFIDTADNYQAGQAEVILSDFISSERDNLVVASKFSMGSSSMLTTGNSRKTMMRAVEESLRRLKTDRLDMYWVHLSDGQTPIDEIVRGLDDLVRVGKILYAGFSNFPAWRIANAALLADLRAMAPIVGIQVEYNLLERSADRELLPMAESLGLGAAFWSPLAGGTLTGKYREEKIDPESRRSLGGGALVKDVRDERESQILDLLATIAEEVDARIIDVSLAWNRQRFDQSSLSTVTIIGPRNSRQLNDNLNSLGICLTNKQISQLNEASKIALGSPHEVIAASQGLLFGNGSGMVQQKHPAF